MAALIKPGWSKPSTILFASEIPANEKAFSFALAQASEFGADLILFHAYDTLVVAASETSGIRYYDYAAAARTEMKSLEPFAKQAEQAGIRCEVVVRPGLPADQILAFLRERSIDRVVMGTHSPGPIGKLLVGSVAEAVLRTSPVPVYIVGPETVEGTYRKFATRTILCAVSLQEASYIVAAFAAELAAQHNARLVLQHVIRPQERAEVLAGRSIDQIEADLLGLVPPELQGKITVQTIGAVGGFGCSWRAGGVGVCCDYAAWHCVQGAGPRSLPGDHALAHGAGRLRTQVRGPSPGRGLYGGCLLAF
jgi:nucleotide-binding universal stress UspA family protein